MVHLYVNVFWGVNVLVVSIIYDFCYSRVFFNIEKCYINKFYGRILRIVCVAFWRSKIAF